MLTLMLMGGRVGRGLLGGCRRRRGVVGWGRLLVSLSAFDRCVLVAEDVEDHRIVDVDVEQRPKSVEWAVGRWRTNAR